MNNICYKTDNNEIIMNYHTFKQIASFELYDNIAEFIENYEVAKKTKKELKTVKKPKGIEKFME